MPNKQICEGDSVLFLDTWYKKEINAAIKLRNKYDCDSIITFELRVIPTINTQSAISLCLGDSIKINNQWLSQEGSYPFAYQSSKGCDSISTYNLTILEAKKGPLQEAILCEDSFVEVYGKIYTQASIVYDTLQAAGGCDSILSTNIKLINKIWNPDTVKYNLCKGDSILIDKDYLKNDFAGPYLYKTAVGCDSIVQLSITFYPQISSQSSISLCQGDSIKIFDKYEKQSGLYQKQFKSQFGCDSLVKIQLTVAPFIAVEKEISFCEGDSIFINDQWIKQATQIKDTIQSVTSCDSIVDYSIKQYPRYTNPQSQLVRLCPDSMITINNTVIATTGQYDFSLQSQNGCDSLVRYQVEKLIAPSSPVIAIDCKNEIYNLSIPLNSTWKHQWSNNSIANDITVSSGEVAIKYTTPEGCVKEYKNTLPAIPKLTDIPQLSDKLTPSNTSVPLTINLDADEWKVQWSPSIIFDCDTCLTTNATSISDTTINVILTHISGCSFTQTFRLLIESNTEIVIPNIFSPQSQSSNKTWSFTLPEGFTITELNVYDRWADKVYSTRNTNTISWDGTMNGKAVVPGVYVYQMKIVDKQGRVVVKVGDVTVVQ